VWMLVSQRVRLWDGKPEPGGIKRLFSIGGSDSGPLEYRGDQLRFLGNKGTLSITKINSIEELKPEINPVQLLVCMAVLFAFFTTYNYLAYGSFIAFIWFPIILTVAGTGFTWWYLKRFGRWVWINYTTEDGQAKDVGFWSAPLLGGSQKIFRLLREWQYPAAKKSE